MTAIAEANSPDPSRAREIARAISARGLLCATYGMGLFFVQVDDVWPGKRGWGILFGLLPLALYLGAGRVVKRYYERRFGWVEPVEPGSVSNRAFVILMVTLIFLFFFGRPIESALSGFAGYLNVMLSGSGRSFFWHPAALWTVWFFPALVFSRNRDWPTITFAVLGTTVVILIGMLPLWFPGCLQSLAWRLFQAGWLSISLMAIGFYDHIRLLLLLPKKVEDPAQ
jgi:hypothetical protein